MNPILRDATDRIEIYEEKEPKSLAALATAHSFAFSLFT